MISADYMAGLPEAYQQIIRDAAKEVVVEERAACQANEQDYIKKLEETGCTINEWEAESYGQLQSTFREYWTTAAEGISDTAVELLDAVLACK